VFLVQEVMLVSNLKKNMREFILIFIIFKVNLVVVDFVQMLLVVLQVIVVVKVTVDDQV
jgi:hypothetical protein